MGTGRLSSFSIAGAGWMTRSTRPPRAQQEWLGSATGMAGNRRGFCRSLLLGVNGGSFGRRRFSFCWLHRDERRRARRTVTGGVASSHMSCSRLLYLRGFFSPLSSSLGGVSSPASSLLLLLRGGTVVRVFQDVKRSCATMELCRPPVRASRGQGEPHDASSLHRENDGRGGVTDDHLCR